MLMVTEALWMPVPGVNDSTLGDIVISTPHGTELFRTDVSADEAATIVPSVRIYSFIKTQKRKGN